MNHFGRVVFICVAMLAVMPVGTAQIVVNQQALQQLEGKAPAASHREETGHRRAIEHRRERHYRRKRPETRKEERHPEVMRPLPLPPPPQPSMAPPPAPKPPPKPKPPHAVTLMFRPQSEALDAVQAQQMTAFAGAGFNRTAHFIVQATAPGVSGDPSVARRMALDRGLAVRDALRTAGVQADHIIVQALGNPPGLPTNRVTVTQVP